jgi:hypothetical protein
MIIGDCIGHAPTVYATVRGSGYSFSGKHNFPTASPLDRSIISPDDVINCSVDSLKTSAQEFKSRTRVALPVSESNRTR